MEQIATIGLDIAKNVFQVQGINAARNVVIRRRLRRGGVLTLFARQQPTLIGIETRATAHYWVRELSAWDFHLRWTPPQDVKSCVKRQ